MVEKRYFYRDALAAAWQAKHHGMRLVIRYEDGEMEEFGIEDGDFPFESLTFGEFESAENWGDVIREPGRPLYIHPDSLPLLEPKIGDVLIAPGVVAYMLQNNMHNLFVRPEWSGWHDAGLAGVEFQIIQRDGKPFFWPEFEER